MSHKRRILGVFFSLLILLSPGLTACQAGQPPTPTPTQTPRTYGYLERSMPTVGSGAPRSASTPTSGRQAIYVVNTGGDGVVLRSAARMDARTATVYPDGTALVMDKQTDGWAHIVSPAEGYIPPQYWSATPP
jgi:hypothetical protein